MSTITDKCQDPNGCPTPLTCNGSGACYFYQHKEAIKQDTKEDKPRIPEFIKLIDDSKAIHLKKNQDYAQENNPFSNFERSALIASWFNDPVDKSFAILVGTKLTRIAELRNGKTPRNESIYDSFLDLGTYCFLWGSYVIRQNMKEIRNL